ncbi:MAG: cupin domain-containing protein [Verrucomicrobia bacterium]|nr:cupin domain-containing protein [Verrucomicrobiota bacterium]MCG2679233.1 cupin domain-containing protein [Kiritimatiellia bacterium]MBU4248627.1 cupin domain-containing protein [Verrucomicrobiota bacterium]MBU4290088.1 cupin domain-containing protein [Verrucomicrobiota bacterium]MBU4429786.1 cupin domain-containing protein [Verrucomicrobiota bacterium]
MPSHQKYMVNYEEIKDLPLVCREDFAGNSARILIGAGSINAPGCMFRATFQPGGFHATHLHTKCDEFVYILSGHGLKGVKDKVYELRAGCAYYLPRGVAHWMLNTHPTESIQVVGFYPNSSDFDGTGYEYLGPIPEGVKKTE